MTIKFSKSRYSLQKDCLGKYYYTYIKGFRDNTLWPGTLGGTTLHLFLEKNFKEVQSLKDIKKLPSFLNLYEEVKKEEIDKGGKYKTPYKFNQEHFINNYEKFLDDIFKFLFLYLPKGKLIFEENLNKKITINNVELDINGIIDLQVMGEDGISIIDFKTTKNNASWYFIDWEHDAQSLSYYYLLREKNPISFAYTIFNVEAKTIITQNNLYHSDYENNFITILNDFIKNHNLANSERVDLYKPEVNKCKWCHVNNFCTVKKLR
jgi:hypothetical protein